MQFFTTGQRDSPKNRRRLVDYIRTQIKPPSGTKPDVQPKLGSDYSQIGQSTAMDKLFGGRRDGFFVECGALDGEAMSNTLLFELERNWTGLLVEPDPAVQKALMTKKRNAYFLPGCLSATDAPSPASFHILDNGFVSLIAGKKINGSAMVQCYPFNSVLEAIGVSHVDYFSLDVELGELAILNTIDFRRIRIDVLMIEYQYPGYGKPKKSVLRYDAYLKFFKEVGERYGRQYELMFHLPIGSTVALGLDMVFKLKN